MADENEEQQEAQPVVEEAAPKPKKGKGLLIVIAVLLILIAIGVPAGYFGYQTYKASQEVQVEVNTEEVAVEGYDDEDLLDEDIESYGAFFPFETLVVNLAGSNYIRVQVQLEFFERNVPRRVYGRIVPLRDKFIQAFAARTAGELATNQGRTELRETLLKITNEVLKKKLVKNVYFTEFVVR